MTHSRCHKIIFRMSDTPGARLRRIRHAFDELHSQKSERTNSADLGKLRELSACASQAISHAAGGNLLLLLQPNYAGTRIPDQAPEETAPSPSDSAAAAEAMLSSASMASRDEAASSPSSDSGAAITWPSSDVTLATERSAREQLESEAIRLRAVLASLDSRTMPTASSLPENPPGVAMHSSSSSRTNQLLNGFPSVAHQPEYLPAVFTDSIVGGGADTPPVAALAGASQQPVHRPHVPIRPLAAVAATISAAENHAQTAPPVVAAAATILATATDRGRSQRPPQRTANGAAGVDSLRIAVAELQSRVAASSTEGMHSISSRAHTARGASLTPPSSARQRRHATDGQIEGIAMRLTDRVSGLEARLSSAREETASVAAVSEERYHRIHALSELVREMHAERGRDEGEAESSAAATSNTFAAAAAAAALEAGGVKVLPVKEPPSVLTQRRRSSSSSSTATVANAAAASAAAASASTEQQPLLTTTRSSAALTNASSRPRDDQHAGNHAGDDARSNCEQQLRAEIARLNGLVASSEGRTGEHERELRRARASNTALLATLGAADANLHEMSVALRRTQSDLLLAASERTSSAELSAARASALEALIASLRKEAREREARFANLRCVECGGVFLASSKEEEEAEGGSRFRSTSSSQPQQQQQAQQQQQQAQQQAAAIAQQMLLQQQQQQQAQQSSAASSTARLPAATPPHSSIMQSMTSPQPFVPVLPIDSMQQQQQQLLLGSMQQHQLLNSTQQVLYSTQQQHTQQQHTQHQQSYETTRSSTTSCASRRRLSIATDVLREDATAVTALEASSAAMHQARLELEATSLSASTADPPVTHHARMASLRVPTADPLLEKEPVLATVPNNVPPLSHFTGIDGSPELVFRPPPLPPQHIDVPTARRDFTARTAATAASGVVFPSPRGSVCTTTSSGGAAAAASKKNPVVFIAQRTRSTAPIRATNHKRLAAACTSILFSRDPAALSTARRVLAGYPDKQIICALASNGARPSGGFIGLYAVVEDDADITDLLQAAVATYTAADSGDGDLAADAATSILHQRESWSSIIAVRIWGSGPLTLTPREVTSAFKFDSASKQFKAVGTGAPALSVTTDAVGVDSSSLVVHVSGRTGAVCTVGRGLV